jgi:DNA-binding XRE family transcriptional regulator
MTTVQRTKQRSQRTTGLHPIRMTGLLFGPVVKARREALAMTRPELAKSVGCPVQSIYTVEKGINIPSIGLAVCICRSLGMRLDPIFGLSLQATK